MRSNISPGDTHAKADPPKHMSSAVGQIVNFLAALDRLPDLRRSVPSSQAPSAGGISHVCVKNLRPNQPLALVYITQAAINLIVNQQCVGAAVRCFDLEVAPSEPYVSRRTRHAVRRATHRSPFDRQHQNAAGDHRNTRPLPQRRPPTGLPSRTSQWKLPWCESFLMSWWCRRVAVAFRTIAV